MTVHSLDTLEERIEKPGYLLFLVVVLLLLIVGFVDLIDYMGEEPVILGRYSVRYFLMMLGYTAFMLFWTLLLFRPNDDRLFRKVLDTLQKHAWSAIGALGLIVLGNVIIVRAGDTIEGAIMTLPAFQIVVMTLSLFFAGLILFYKWGADDRPQRWRKIVLGVLGAILAIELVVQALAAFGVFRTNLDSTQSFDYYSPYNRVYQTEEGFGTGLTNNYGRYASEFELLPDSYRIAIVGDSFVDGLQVRKDEQFGHLLEERLLAGEAEQTFEVLPIGHTDKGPGLYLSTWLMEVMNRELAPDEAIIFFDMGNDFQITNEAGQGLPYFYFDESGELVVDKQLEFRDFHEAEHYIYRGYKGFQPVLMLRTNFLTPRLIQEALGIDRFARPNAMKSDDINPVNPVNPDIDRPNGFVFNPTTNEHVLDIAAATLALGRDEMAKAGAGARVVVNPAFTAAFFAQDQWNTIFGDSDLLLPERRLAEAAVAEGIPFLGLGTYMAAQGLSPADVQALYFADGLGHLTQAGHEFVAEAIYRCFYAETVTAEVGCLLP